MAGRFQKLQREPCFMATRLGPINYSLARSSRRSTIEIAVTDSMEVCVSAPRYSTDKEIRAFISDKAHWIIEKIKEVQHANRLLKARQYEKGHQFLFLGEKYPLEIEESKRRYGKVQFDQAGWKISVPAGISERERQTVVKQKLTQWYRNEAKEIFGSRIFHYSRIMGVEPLKIAVKTQKRIWGNCDYRQKIIHLNWYLVLAPLDVIDYVVVHELSHLEVPNHSRKFWKTVEKHYPGYRLQQKWLKNNSLNMMLP